MTRPLKVLLFTDSHNKDSGGAESYFFKLKSLLSERQDIDVVSMGFGPTAHRSRDAIVLKDSGAIWKRQLWNMFTHTPTFKLVQQHIRDIAPDVIHLHNVRRHTPAVLRAMRPWRVIQTVHDFAPICPTMTNVHRDLTPCPHGLRLKCCLQHRGRYPLVVYPGLLLSFLHLRAGLKRSVRHFVAPSPVLAGYLEANHFAPVTVVTPFVEESLPASDPTAEPGRYFLFVGRLSRYKGADLLLREFAIACRTRPDLQLKLAGQGPLEIRLKEYARKSGIERNVEFCGQITDKNALNQLYRQATALIFASTVMESFGLVMTEAMAHGRPVIGTNFGTPVWLIRDGETGLHFEPGRAGDLAQKMLRLAEDPLEAVRMGEQARQSLQQFPNTNACTDALIALYGSVAKRTDA